MTPITRRSDLLTLLSEACELEHGLSCSYLYAAFSLKRDLSEGGLTWEQLQMVRRWAGQIYFVASQEMLHLAQVWNLLTAIGGTPYYYRPNFPQSSKYYPLHLRLSLDPFCEETIKRFIFYESPVNVSAERSFEKDLASKAQPTVAGNGEAAPFEFHTVGELYELIASGFKTIPEEELFIGNPGGQAGSDLVDFPDIIKVSNGQSAAAAINIITHQGEGTNEDRDDCHFGMYHAILKEYLAEIESSRKLKLNFDPVRPVIDNPIAEYLGDYGSRGGHPIKNNDTRKVAKLFDSIYNLMLRMLAYTFTYNAQEPETSAQFSHAAIAMMPTVILPLGEVLTMLPAGRGSSDHGKTGGPGFGLTRHIPLHSDPLIAVQLVGERMSEISKDFEMVKAMLPDTSQIERAAERFGHLRATIQQLQVS